MTQGEKELIKGIPEGSLHLFSTFLLLKFTLRSSSLCPSPYSAALIVLVLTNNFPFSKFVTAATEDYDHI